MIQIRVGIPPRSRKFLSELLGKGGNPVRPENFDPEIPIPKFFIPKNMIPNDSGFVSP